jgi:SAM-dependent methyltransferase
MMTFNQTEATTRWNSNSETWHRVFGENDVNRRDLLDPLILQLLGEVKGQRVLDAGCGDGYLSRKLARLGASLTGVELAEAMLKFAVVEEARNPLGIAYYHGSICTMSFLPSESFDIALTNNVMQDVEDYRGAVSELARALKPGGMYLQIINHPCFAMPGTGWVRDEKGQRLYRKVDYYFKRGPFLAEWARTVGMEPTLTWHRTLGDVINPLIDAGLSIARVIEPEPPESWRDNPRINDAFRIPDFLVLVCQKGTAGSYGRSGR